MKLLHICPTLLLLTIGNSSTAAGQVRPDYTLPENSLIQQQGPITIINGGTLRGSNLFHSFENFSVNIGEGVLFNNPATVQNILARVTGRSSSSINGWLGANGAANLFLINPNGILFGSDANLQIGGAFIASTAERITFQDGFFSTASDAPSLLSLNVPIGLGFGTTPGPIQVQGTGHFFRSNFTSPILEAIPQPNIPIPGLIAAPAQTLILAGGNVSLNNALITAPGGRVEIASVSRSQELILNWNPTPTLNYSRISHFSNIQLQGLTGINTTGLDGGSIHLQGRNIAIGDGSLLISQNLGGVAHSPIPPAITIIGSHSITVSGSGTVLLDPANQTPTTILSSTLSSRRGGDINLLTPQLTLVGGGAINTRTYASGRAGNININAARIDINGFSPQDISLVSGIGSFSFANGNAGNIRIDASELQLRFGGSIVSGTFAQGRGGKISISANSTIIDGFLNPFRFTDVSLDEILPSNLLNPDFFTPSQISAFAFSSGNAGDINLSSQELSVVNGATIFSSTLAQGDAGSINIAASEVTVSSIRNLIEQSPITLEQLNQLGIPRSNRLGSISSAALRPLLLSRIFNLPQVPQGSSGSVIIQTDTLNVVDEGSINVGNDGINNAGDLEIIANQINLNNGGNISATTRTGRGGNINIQTHSLVQNRGEITSSAGGSGNGGNLSIHASSIIGNQAAIAANAVQGFGGRVQINTNALFFNGQITATSERGPEFNGIVEIQAPDPDLTRGILPIVSLVSTPELDRHCQTASPEQVSSFVITGRGGVPASPNIPQRSTVGWTAPLPSSSEQPEEPVPIPLQSDPIEAIRWVIHPDGRITLVAEPGSAAAIANSHTLGCSDQVRNYQTQLPARINGAQ